MNISLIFLAGGKGTRFGAEFPKQFLTLCGKPVALHSFALLSKLPQLTEIALVCSKQFHPIFPQDPRIVYATPGEERFLSVEHGLEVLSDEETLVLIHDAARPLLEQRDLLNLIEKGSQGGAATLAQQVTQTIKQTDTNGCVVQTIPRETLWEIHTPQAIQKSLLKEGVAYRKAHNIHVSDDVSLVEALGKPVHIVPSSKPNIKITRKEDYHVAAALLQL